MDPGSPADVRRRSWRAHAGASCCLQIGQPEALRARPLLCHGLLAPSPLRLHRGQLLLGVVFLVGSDSARRVAHEIDAPSALAGAAEITLVPAVNPQGAVKLGWRDGAGQ